MKQPTILLLVLLTLVSCKKEKEDMAVTELTTAQKIANAHGFEQWKNVKQIEFTFNVDRDQSHFERHWIWKPKTNNVTMMTKTDTIAYVRSQLDSISLNADRSFINDKFWLFIPFQLVWDEGTSISDPERTLAPISKDTLHKITLLYGNEGGYTPGDAYDLYYDDDFIIKEWAFRKSNAAEPSLINSFENYQDFNGIKLALEHKKPNEDWNLNFTNVKVILED